MTQHEPCTDIGQQAEWGELMGDVDCNDEPNSVDALKILRYTARLPVSLPGGCPEIGPPWAGNAGHNLR